MGEALNGAGEGDGAGGAAGATNAGAGGATGRGCGAGLGDCAAQAGRRTAAIATTRRVNIDIPGLVRCPEYKKSPKLLGLGARKADFR